MPIPAAVPLARLMAMGLRSLVDELHVRLARRGYHLRPAFAFVLLASRERALTGNDVASLLGMTKQAASKLADTMEEEHYLTRKPHPEDARAKLLQIAPRGRRVLEAAEDIYGELEAEWAKVIGKARLEALRADLSEVLRATHGGALPPIRPTW
ncbi:MAG: transcriptional regulator, MarR family [Myxococcaceae bacterium]|nr:transcriptional regulator, MarR family [Myxococcaceae bacterium]